VRLRRSDLTGDGIRRVRSGRGFRYLDADGRPIRPEDLARIKNLVIPPAWIEVWICPWPNGHIQAVGFDAAGRRQYLYHPRWREKRDQEKHDHVLEFAAALPDARTIIAAELAGRGLTRSRVLAAAVRLLDLGFFRVGGERYAEDHGTYGLATLRREHVHFSRGEIVFSYQAKGGLERVQAVSPVPRSSATGRKRAVARVVTEVSQYLGNTPAVCRASYIDPRVIERYHRGDTIVSALDHLGDTGPGSLATQGAIEQAVLDLLGASPAKPPDP
jgi:DNA topoisomerase IB